MTGFLCLENTPQMRLSCANTYCLVCKTKLNSLHMATLSLKLTQHVYISALTSTLCESSAAEPGALDLPFEIVALCP